MGFGGIATVIEVGIGIYYGTNSSEEIKKEMDSFKLTDSAEKASNGENSDNSIKLGTDSHLQDGDSDSTQKKSIP